MKYEINIKFEVSNEKLEGMSELMRAFDNGIDRMICKHDFNAIVSFKEERQYEDVYKLAQNMGAKMIEDKLIIEDCYVNIGDRYPIQHMGQVYPVAIDNIKVSKIHY